MLSTVPNDILLYLTKYLYTRDMIRLRLTSRYFRDHIQCYYKIFDDTKEITFVTDSIQKTKCCTICGLIITEDGDVKFEYCPRCNIFYGKLNLDQKTIYITNSRKYTLFSMQDLDCFTGTCFCQSKKKLFYHPNLPSSLVPVGRGRREKFPKFIFETDYGRVCFDSSKYTKKNVLFMDIIIYYSQSGPEILQTFKHHWVVLKYSKKIIPIKNIFLKTERLGLLVQKN